MRIAIPSETSEGLSSMRAGHFGHAPYFTVVSIENGEISQVEAVKNVDHDEFGCGGVIEHALGLDLDGIIATGMGRPPFQRFTSGGVTVYSELETPMVGDVVTKFIAGEVPMMAPDAACNHHH